MTNPYENRTPHPAFLPALKVARRVVNPTGHLQNKSEGLVLSAHQAHSPGQAGSQDDEGSDDGQDEEPTGLHRPTLEVARGVAR